VNAAIACLFLVSGLAGLLVETTWMAWFRLLFGATAPASSATLVAFFTGHALGAAWAARRAAGWTRPLAVYGVLELVAAGGSLAVPLLLRGGELLGATAYDALRDAPGALTAMRLAIALAATLPAAAAMGATLPAIASHAIADPARLAGIGTGLYALNTGGAAIGAALAAFVLPERIGVFATYGVALALQCAAGGIALALARTARAPARTPRPPAPRPARRPGRRSREPREAASERALLGFAALSGFVAFALQVLLIQSFAQVLNLSGYAFGAVAVTVLATLAAGAALVSAALSRRAVEPATLLGIALALAGLAVAAFPDALHRATRGFSYLGAEGAWPAYLLAALGQTLRTACLPLLACALVFPLVLALAGTARARDGADAHPGRILGRLVTANTLGSIAGALAAPYLLFPLLGPWLAFAVLAVALAAGALFVPEPSAQRRLARDVILGVGWIAVLSLASPLGLPPTRLAADETLLFVDPTPAGVVSVVGRGSERLIRLNAHYALGGTAETVHQERQGHLPLLLHPTARTVAFLGPATGSSAGAALAHPAEAITLVELVPGVARAARGFFGPWNRGVYESPRARLVVDDARNFLRSTGERFDLVVGDLFVPWHAGTGALYSVDHFAATRARLTEHGVFCQWLPLYQLTEAGFRTIAASFLAVFPRAALFRGDFYGRHPIVALVGFAGDPAHPAAVAAAASRLHAAGERDRWVTDPSGVFALYVGPLTREAAGLEGTPLETDDRPRVEYIAARSHAGGARGVDAPFVALDWSRFAGQVRAYAREHGDPLYPELPKPAHDASDGGAALQAAGALFVAGRSEDSSRALAAASRLLPTQLLAGAPEDPTAAEVWWDAAR
jgi:spermidine synthase